jgi:hypothetical protein
MSSKISPLAGKPAPTDRLVNVSQLVVAYYGQGPDPSVPAHVAQGWQRYVGDRGAIPESYVKPTFIMLPFSIISELSRTHRHGARLTRVAAAMYTAAARREDSRRERDAPQPT